MKLVALLLLVACVVAPAGATVVYATPIGHGGAEGDLAIGGIDDVRQASPVTLPGTGTTQIAMVQIGLDAYPGEAPAELWLREDSGGPEPYNTPVVGGQLLASVESDGNRTRHWVSFVLDTPITIDNGVAHWFELRGHDKADWGLAFYCAPSAFLWTDTSRASGSYTTPGRGVPIRVYDALPDAPGLPAIALFGIAPIAGCLLRRRH